MAKRLYVDADNNIEFLGVMDHSTEAYINNATVTFALKEEDGDAVTSGSGTCSYVAASDGDYIGVLDAAADINVGQSYWLEVTMTASGGYNDFRRVQCVGAYREET